MSTTPSPQESSFPQFADGNVTIIVSTRHQFRLHSRTLRSAEWFRDQFDTIAAPKLSAQARRNGATPYRFVLVETPRISDEVDDQYEPEQALMAVEVSDNGAFVPVVPRASVNDLSGDDADKYWYWLFGSFYGISPNIDETTFGTTVRDCVHYLDVGDTVGADLRKEIDLTLMRQDEPLWKAIANRPTVWAELGRRIRSPTIFKEAVIHLVGKWKMLESFDRERLSKDIAKLCQRKWNELELAKRAIEIRIAGHYPSFLLRNHADKPHRTAYSNDIYMWMVLSYFRQYLAQSGTDRKNRLAKDGGYKWYKQIYDGGSTYLDHDSMRMFHSYFPMSVKAVGVMEQNMNVLKDDVKIFVKDLMVSRTHINPGSLQDQKPWLTCAVIEDDDLPRKATRTEDNTEVVVDFEDEAMSEA